MKTLLYLAGMASSLAVFAPSGHAQSTEALDLANRVFDRAGLAVQLQSLPAQFEEGLAQNRGKVSDEMIAAAAEAGRKAFAVAPLREEIVGTLAEKFPVADMKGVLGWLEGKVGRLMTLAEESAAGNVTQQNMQAYFESEKLKPANPKRAALIVDLMEATNTVESGARLFEALTFGVMVGMDSAQPVEKQLGLSNLRARMRAALPPDKLRANMRAAIPPTYGFTYRGVSDGDLAAYVKFNKSALGKRYYQAVMEALTAALAHASVRVGEIIQAAPERKKI
jgi:hypothetical protein